MKPLRLASLAALFALVLGCHWAVIDRYGSDLPNWDQWDAEAMLMLGPWINHTFSFATPFIPQNEHRVVLTKLLNLALTLANGQWDQRLEAVVNAVLPGAIAVAWVVFAEAGLGRRWRPLAWVVAAAAYAAPLSWQNVVSGFHSQQLFLVGLSFGAIGLLGVAEPWSRRWWLGAACGALALGSMATGFFAAPLGAAAAAGRRWRRGAPLPWPTLGFGVLIAIAGWVGKAPQPGHEVLKAHGAGDFMLSVLRSLQWPIVDRDHPAAVPAWAALPLWLPWLLLFARTLWRSEDGARGRAQWVLAALGGWVLLQVAATAYARGAGGDPPASRYVDTLVFGAVVNAVSAAWLIGAFERRRKVAAACLGLAWAAAFGVGADGELSRNFHIEFPAVRAYYANCVRSVRNYLATGDENYLQPGSIPYPSADLLIDRLNIDGIRAWLPAGVRPPLALASAPGSTGFWFHGTIPPQASTFLPPDLRRGPAAAPAAPVLENARVRGSYGPFGPAPGSWTSQPARAARGWLEFETSGEIGPPGTRLELRDASDQRVLAEVRPSREPGESWRVARVPAPRGPFVVAASADGSGRWLAFGDPVEMAPLSYLAWWAGKKGLGLAWIAGAAGLLLLAAEIKAGRSGPSPRPPSR
ncbi:MAG TPA: hypothetical protein VHC86_08950 [Opitutaceae bacterium]|nr:hypothetical protein [Opitutaceae bacterium]